MLDNGTWRIHCLKWTAQDAVDISSLENLVIILCPRTFSNRQAYVKKIKWIGEEIACGQ